MWPGITPAMKQIVLRMQSIPGPATSMTEMGGPGLVRVVGKKLRDLAGKERRTKDVDEEDHESF